MINGKSRGHRLQDELYRWYLLIIREEACGATQNVVPGLNDLKHHVEVLMRAGWQLTMSADNSPADKCGVDFIWANPGRGWFPLDAKAVGQTSCSLIQHVYVGNNTDAGEYKQLRYEDKLAFLEQLVTLARIGEPITYEECMPPSTTAMGETQLLEAVKSFQRTLERASSIHEGFLEWSVALRKAVGYLQAKKRGGPSEDALLAARSVIASAIDSFFAAYFNQGNNTFASKVMHLQPCLRRSERLIYLVTEDSIKTTVGKSQELVILGGLASLIMKRFEARYTELIGKHRGADWLIQRKRTFEAKGVECVIHNILDTFQQQNPGRRVA